MAIVEHPTLGQIEFPDDMGDDQIVSAIKNLETQQPPAQPPVQQPAAQAQPSFLRGPDTTRSTITGMTAGEAQARGEYGSAMLGQAVRDVAPTAIRAGSVLAAPLVAPAIGLGAIGTLAFGGLTSAIGEGVASNIEGRSPQEQAANTLQAGILGMSGAPTAASMAAPSRSVAGIVGRGLQEAAEIGGQAYTSSVAGDITGRLVRGEDFSLGDVLAENATPGAIGTAVGLTSATGRVVGQTLKYADDNRRALAAVNVKSPTAGMVLAGDPNSLIAKAERRLLTSNSDFRRQVQESLSKVGLNLDDVARETPRMDELAKALTPYAQDLAALSNQAEAARENARVAIERLNSAKLATGVASDADLLNAQNAIFQKIGADAAMVDMLGTVAPEVAPLQKASETIIGNIESLLDVKSQIANQKYAASGVDAKQALFDSNRLVSAAAKAIAPLGNPSTKEEVLGLLNNYRKEAQGIQLLGPDGRPLPAPPKQYSLEELREIKTYLADKMTPASGRLSSGAQNVINQAYDAINREATGIIGQALGPESAARFADAQQYYAQFSDAYGNSLLRQLENPEQRATAIQTVANGIANTDFSQFKAYQDLVKAVYRDAPSVGNLAAVPLKQAVKVAMFNSARDGTRINIKTLANNVAQAAKTGKEYGFDSQQLGLGDARTADNWQKILSRRGIKDLTEDEAQAFFSSKGVQQALTSAPSKGQTAILDRAAAELAFMRKAQQVAAAEAFGRMKNSPRIAELQREAQRLAGSKEEANKLLAAARRNPLTVAINDLRLANDIQSSSKAAQGVASQFTNTIVNSDPLLARELKKGLLEEAKRNPRFSRIPELIETRLIKDVLVGFEPSSLGSGSQLKFRKFADVFNPPVGQTNQLQVLKEFIPAERLQKLKSAARVMADLGQYQANVALPSQIGDSAATAAGVARGGFESAGTVFATLVKRLADLGAKSYHGAVTAAVLDDGFAKALVKNGGNITATLSEIGPARAIALSTFVPELQEEANAQRPTQ